METNSQVARAVRRAVAMSAIAAAGASMPAFSQDQAKDAASEELTTVVVTGSRIKQANLTTTSPVTQVTAQDITTQGVTKIEDLINQLPQAFAAQNARVSNGSAGTATVDLRGLGSARTLVLVDGRRMPYGGVSNSAADLNQIPSNMVERVEVLTGGASAVYGSDAVSGVVNFIMKKNFEGVQVDLQYNINQHNNSFGGPGALPLRTVITNRALTNAAQFKLPKSDVWDGAGKEASVLMGLSTEDGRGNVTMYAGWRDNKEILQANRDYSACSLDTAPPTVSFACGGSSTSFPGRFFGLPTSLGVANPFSRTVDSTGAGNTLRNFSGAIDQYNFGPINHFQRPDTRYNLGAIGHYELNEHADVYSQLMFTDYRSTAQIAPGGIFFGSNTYSISCANPLLSAQQATSIGCGTARIIADGNRVNMFVGRRNVEGGGRQQDFHNSSFRGLVGVKGKISESWDYDVSGQFSRVSADQLTKNYFVNERITRALDVVSTPNGPACQSVVDGTDRNCVPYNLWTLGQITPAALAYLQAPGLQTGVIDQNVITATVSGDFGAAGIKLPSAAEPLAVVFGAEYRRDKLNNVTDANLTAGNLSGSGGPTISIGGQTNVTDIFMEARLPLINDKPFARSASIETAYRYSDYGSGVSTNTFKFSGDWAPVEDVRFRASFQRAIRAANVVELFTAQGNNLFDLAGDPCGTDSPNPNATLAKCVATGLPAANYRNPLVPIDSPAGQYNFLQGGNLALKPETSDTTSFGVVFTPSFVPGLNVTLDYFNIKIDDTISTVGSENTLNACYNNNDAAACSRIHRSPSIGALWVTGGRVDDLNINIGGLKTSGIDLNAGYAKLPIGRAGSLNFNITGTYLKKIEVNPGSGLVAYDCTKFFGSVCGSGAINQNPNPQWRHHARVGWKTPWEKLDLAFTWRYYGKVDLKNAAANRIDASFPSFNYFDLAASIALKDKVDITVGINNLTDKDPPLNANVGTGSGNGNTYPGAYEATGRYIFAGMKVNF